MNFAKPASVIGATTEALQSACPRRKWPISYRSVGGIAMASDIFIIMICGIATGALYNFIIFGATDDIPQYLGSSAVVAAFFVSVMKGHGLYSPAELLSLRTQLGSAVTTWLGVFLFLSGAAFALKIGGEFSRAAIFSFAVLGLLLLVIQRIFIRTLLTRGLEGQRFAGRNAVLICDNSPAAGTTLVSTLLKHGFRLDHQFTLPADDLDSKQQESFISDVIGYLRGSDIEEVVVSVDAKRWGDLRNLLAGLRLLPLPIHLIPVGAASDIFQRPSHVMGGSVYVELQREPLGTFERGIKRSIDVLSALLALFILAPMLAVTALLIKLDSSGPILFRQKRCGFNGRPFDIYKFRTMSVMEDGPTVCQATRTDQRVTRLGRQLRRASIDELPQLFNVLNGSMSLVGPRPHAVAHDDQFDKIVSNYAFRHHVKPGLTGWAQVNGHRGATPTLAEIENRVKCDLWYIDNWSLRLDLLIIMRTIVEVMRGRNAY